MREVVAVTVGVYLKCVRWYCIYSGTCDTDPLMRHIYDVIGNGIAYLRAGDYHYSKRRDCVQKASIQAATVGLIVVFPE